MIPNPPPVVIPDSYERVPLKAVKAAPHSPGVIVVTLNRPNKQNAFTLDMMEDLETLYAMFDVDERVKVVVLTGAGRTFCAGADLEIGFSAANEVKRVMDERDRSVLRDLGAWRRLSWTVVGVWRSLFIAVANQPLRPCKAPLSAWG